MALQSSESTAMTASGLVSCLSNKRWIEVDSYVDGRRSLKVSQETRDRPSVVSVVIKGSITIGVYKIWADRIREKGLSDIYAFKDHLALETKIIVVDETLDIKLLSDWAKAFQLSKQISIVKPSWLHSLLSERSGNTHISQFTNFEIIRALENRPPVNISLAFPKSVPSLSEAFGNKFNEDSNKVDAVPVANNEPSFNTSSTNVPKFDVTSKFMCANANKMPQASHTLANNQRIIKDLLEAFESYHENINDPKLGNFRARAYKGAVIALRSLKVDLNKDNYHILKEYKNIGKRIYDKIVEFILTGKCEELNNLINSDATKCIDAFSKVHGIGSKTARRLYESGARSIEDLRKMPGLNESIKVGLKHYDDALRRIDREEVVEIGRIVGDQLQRLIPGSVYTICGSFRRGKPTSGDVDVIICPPHGYEVIEIVDRIVYELSNQGFLTDHLARNRKTLASNAQQPLYKFDKAPNYYVKTAAQCVELSWDHTYIEETRKTYMGFCKVPGRCYHRRIDIKSYPRSLYAFGLLYFTGSEYFNRSMRLLAQKRGLSLSDKGLTKRFTDGSGKRLDLNLKNSYPCLTEEDIFKALGIEYVPPQKRDALQSTDKVVLGGGEVDSDDVLEDSDDSSCSTQDD